VAKRSRPLLPSIAFVRQPPPSSVTAIKREVSGAEAAAPDGTAFGVE
jgi:hypothetical protein